MSAVSRLAWPSGRGLANHFGELCALRFVGGGVVGEGPDVGLVLDLARMPHADDERLVDRGRVDRIGHGLADLGGSGCNGDVTVQFLLDRATGILSGRGGAEMPVCAHMLRGEFRERVAPEPACDARRDLVRVI
jgi:hypothetical protein